mmetsp:Transcript_4173/g.16226  ORF Transcript_4173/g.16226 Transcript_4173/m.16226 type:complete len:414 (+) Transcript_4173:671-1912(+)
MVPIQLQRNARQQLVLDPAVREVRPDGHLRRVPVLGGDGLGEGPVRGEDEVRRADSVMRIDARRRDAARHPLPVRGRASRNLILKGSLRAPHQFHNPHCDPLPSERGDRVLAGVLLKHLAAEERAALLVGDHVHQVAVEAHGELHRPRFPREGHGRARLAALRLHVEPLCAPEEHLEVLQPDGLPLLAHGVAHHGRRDPLVHGHDHRASVQHPIRDGHDRVHQRLELHGVEGPLDEVPARERVVAPRLRQLREEWLRKVVGLVKGGVGVDGSRRGAFDIHIERHSVKADAQVPRERPCAKENALRAVALVRGGAPLVKDGVIGADVVAGLVLGKRGHLLVLRVLRPGEVLGEISAFVPADDRRPRSEEVSQRRLHADARVRIDPLVRQGVQRAVGRVVGERQRRRHLLQRLGP